MYPAISESSSGAQPDASASPLVLIIDNYDSFTYNIHGALAKLGIDSVVVRNDAITREGIERLNPSHIIISPGPGTPDNPEDIGVTNDAIAFAIERHRCLLGICLGHQAIARYFGGKIVRAQEIRHGKTSQIDIAEDGGVLFEGVDADASVMRYHSLVADPESLPEVLRVTARTRDATKTIMSLEHGGKTPLPIFGVQFHPESFATPEGLKILQNFLKTDPKAYEMLQRSGVPQPKEIAQSTVLPSALRQVVEKTEQRSFEQIPFDCDLAPEQVYRRLHAASDHSYCFESLDANGGERVGRFSYFGVDPAFVLSARNHEFFFNDQSVDIGDLSAFEALNGTVEQLRARSRTQQGVLEGQQLTGGFVGFMGYEAIQYREPSVGVSTPPGQKTFSYGYFSDGLVYDNLERRYFYYTRGENRMEMYKDLLCREPHQQKARIRKTSEGISSAVFQERVRCIRDEHIRRGETFQTVLSRKETYRLEEGSLSDVYLALRETCPSGNMHAVCMGNEESIGSFPELTLKVSDGEATTYQVAGTRPRTGDAKTDAAAWEDLSTDPKELAEHRMLVDLARNDLEMSSIPGTVELIPEMLMHRLDAGKVMHIASEVRSNVNGLPPFQALLDIAPMGTVSGAPKVRSMQFIRAFEQGDARGLYAGSFGFVDMRGNLEAVVGLRSVMRYGQTLVTQAGAGIVFDSVPEREYEETVQKMRAARGAIEPFLITS